MDKPTLSLKVALSGLICSLAGVLMFNVAVPGAGSVAQAGGLAEAPQAVAAVQMPATPLGRFLEGSASVDRSIWTQYFSSGVAALENRQYSQANSRLQLALTELRRRNCNDLRLIETKTALAEALFGLERFESAERLFTDAAERAEHGQGTADAVTAWHARALHGLAKTLLVQAKVGTGKYVKADQVCRQALALQEKVSESDSREAGVIRVTLADILSAQGLDSAAIEMYEKSLAILQKSSGVASFDLASAEYGLAMALRAQGEERTSDSHFQQAFAVQDRLVHFNSGMDRSGKLVVRWQPGNPRSRQIADADYPLKYVMVNGLRVAATLVRSENVIAALISLSNCTRSRIDLLTGPVSLEQLTPHRKTFMYVPPGLLDMELEAEHVTALTWRRGWLNHIEKTRRIPGYLSDGVLDADNFFGNNTFGDYANWGTIARSHTPIVTREQLYKQMISSERSDDSVDFLCAGSPGLQPTYLDPGDSQTGLVYFKQEKFDLAQLKVVVGNVVAEIPFVGAGPR